MRSPVFDPRVVVCAGAGAGMLFSGGQSPGGTAAARIAPGTSAPSGATGGMSGVLSHMLRQASASAAAPAPEAAPSARVVSAAPPGAPAALLRWHS